MSGAGAAGTAILKLLLAAGARDVVVADIDGVVHAGSRRTWRPTCAGSPSTPTGRASPAALREALVGADVFIGVSAPNLLTGEDIATMAEDAIVFALANPEPEVDPAEAAELRRASSRPGAATSRTRSTTCSPFPGSSAACSTPRAAPVTTPMLLAAARALADVVTETSSTRPTSCRRCSTPTWRRGGRRGARGRPARAAAGRRVRWPWAAFAAAVLLNLVVLFSPRAGGGGLVAGATRSCTSWSSRWWR